MTKADLPRLEEAAEVIRLLQTDAAIARQDLGKSRLERHNQEARWTTYFVALVQMHNDIDQLKKQP